MILPLKCPKCGNEIVFKYDDYQLADDQTEDEMMKAFQELGIKNPQNEKTDT